MFCQESACLLVCTGLKSFNLSEAVVADNAPV